MTVLELGAEVKALAARMEAFEARESVANTGTGSRREGGDFERVVAEMWTAFQRAAATHGAKRTTVSGEGVHRYARLTVGPRSLYVPEPDGASVTGPATVPSQWLQVVFHVDDLIAAFPTESEAIRRYAPSKGEYAGQRYPEMYSRLVTKFDDTVVLEDSGVLREKILLEYKTAKSSRGRQIDGNAHERLSFQIMQYLEVATRYTRCSFTVIGNGAFIRYRNKYHVNFHVQADRLSNFAWFSMQYACVSDAYLQFLAGLLSWLVQGTPRPLPVTL